MMSMLESRTYRSRDCVLFDREQVKPLANSMVVLTSAVHTIQLIGNGDLQYSNGPSRI